MMIWATGMTAIATFRYAGVLALLGVTLVWGDDLPAMKLLANDVPALHILALRFGLASVVLLPLFVRLRGAEWRWGLVLGLLNFIAFWLQTEGLALISSNRNAFITGLNVLIVPLLAWVVLRRPMGWAIALACALALGGLQLMFFEDSAWSWGDTLSPVQRRVFALFILTLELCALRNRQQPLRATRLAAVVSLTMCACSVLVALGMEAQPLLAWPAVCPGAAGSRWGIWRWSPAWAWWCCKPGASSGWMPRAAPLFMGWSRCLPPSPPGGGLVSACTRRPCRGGAGQRLDGEPVGECACQCAQAAKTRGRAAVAPH